MLFGKFINKYYKKYFLFFVIGILCLIAVDWIQLYLPKYLGELVDLFKENKINNELLLSYVWKLLAIAGAMFIGRVGWRLTLFYASKKIESDLRHDMFIKAENLAVHYYHHNKTGEIMSWLTSDLETMEEYVGWGSLMMIDGIFLTVFSFFYMFKTDWALTVIAIIPIILIAVWGALVEKIMGMKWKARQESFDRLYDYSQENFSGIRVVKAFVKENQQIRKFSAVSTINKDMNVAFFKASIIFDVIITVLINLIFALILGLGGFLVFKAISGEPFSLFGENISRTSGSIISYIGYFDTLIWPMIALGQVITMYSKAHASYKRIAKFLDEKEDIVNCENPIDVSATSGDIHFVNFSFKYPSQKHLHIKNLNADIHKGELIGVIGKVGSGKSTIINILLRIYNFEEGHVFLDDVDIMKADVASLRKAISYVPQDNFLFSVSVKENIAYGVKEYREEDIIEAAKFADVHENIMSFPDKYDTVSGERGQTLSGGQKQRIAIARAYIKKSPIMVLDDSVSAVDIKTEEKILENIKTYRKDKTTIIVASRISTIKNADRVMVFNSGELEAFASPSELIKISPTYKHMVELQQLEKEDMSNE